MAKFGGSAKNSDILQRVSLCARLVAASIHTASSKMAPLTILPEGGDVHHAHAVIRADINAPLPPRRRCRCRPPAGAADDAGGDGVQFGDARRRRPAPSRELRISPAMATIRPLMANTASLVRSTLIPDRRAASVAADGVDAATKGGAGGHTGPPAAGRRGSAPGSVRRDSH